MDKGIYGRRDRLVQEKEHDPYRETEKWPEPTVCTRCGALFTEGRWTWGEAPVDANKVVCPACQRVEDNYPAGFLELQGRFLVSHGREIRNLIRNEERQEKELHPMERIMMLEEDGDKIVITTTGVHIARRIGEAVYRAYQGDLSFTYGDGDKTIRLTWSRDA